MEKLRFTVLLFSDEEDLMNLKYLDQIIETQN